MGKWQLRLTITGPAGERYDNVVDITDDVLVDKLMLVSPPSLFQHTFEDAVQTMRRRELRKDRFEALAQQLARSLGEHLEDAEGWHGEDRQGRMRKHFGVV